MVYRFVDEKLDARFVLWQQLGRRDLQSWKADELSVIIWNRGDHPEKIVIDSWEESLKPGQITTTTFVQHVEIPAESSGLTAFGFNRAFYCINDHDQEVSCNGLLFFGAQERPVVQLTEKECGSLEALLSVFKEEFETADNIQGEMLQMLLKRLIIKVTRLAKDQLGLSKLDNAEMDLIRRYHLLVDEHFRDKKKVADYAELLFKSPKTLSNLFSSADSRSPLQIIHDRIVLEARRLLTYSDLSSGEIAAQLGYDDPAPFNKLFKRSLGQSPSAFRKAMLQNG